MKQPIFTGVATALVTPFRGGAIDLSALEQLLDAQLAAGIDAIVVCGTTGEASTLSSQEQLTLIAHTLRYVHGPLQSHRRHRLQQYRPRTGTQPCSAGHGR